MFRCVTPSFRQTRLAFFLLLPKSTEDAMKQDLAIVTGGIVVTGLAMWSVWGNPPKHSAPRVVVVQQLQADPDLKAISERSPYMRSER
jgi:hypothetical protein